MIALTLLLTALALLTSLAFAIHHFGRREPQLPSGPALAVVLGARVDLDGTPSPALEGRVATAVDLLHTGQAYALLLSGGVIGPRPAEAVVMAELAKRLGARDEQLHVERLSTCTFENATRCAEWLANQEPREVILVTCDFHLARATAYFRAQRLSVWPVPSRRQLSALQRATVTSKEVLAFLRRPWLLLEIISKR